MSRSPFLACLTAALALALAAPSFAQSTEEAPAPVGRKLIEIYRVAPGQHEAFLRAIAQFDEVNRRAGIPSRQLYVHSDGASWDFLLIQDAAYPEGAGERVGAAWDELRLPSGPRFFTEFRAFILEHTDTFAAGPTTAADWLARLDATPASAGLGAVPPAGYRLRTSVALGGAPRWDYLQVDPAARRVFVAHDDAVDVVDLGTLQRIGRVTGLAGAHGIALAPGLDSGFVANGDRGTVTAFSLGTFAATAEVAVGEEPDSATFEPLTGRLLVWNGGSRDVSILEGSDLTPVATVPLGATPEFAVADGRGAVYVNLEETAEIARVDAAGAAVGRRLPLAGCEAPGALAIDPERQVLYSACSNRRLLAVDAATGRVLGTGAIGAGVDAVVFDAARSRVLVASAEGFVTVFDTDVDGRPVRPVEVQTRATGRTMALDPATGALLVPAAGLALDWGTRTAVFADGGLALHVFEPVGR